MIFEPLGISAILALSAYTAYKMRRVHLKTFELQEILQRQEINFTQQLQHLEALRLELKLDRLPILRGWAASPDFLLVIATHVRKNSPRTVVECSSGASTVVLARALQLAGEGRVFSLEHDPEYAERTRELLAEFNLSDWATVITAPLKKIVLKGEVWPWYQIDALPSDPIDMIVVDGPPLPVRKCSRYPAGPMLFNRLSPGASVFLDDADRADEKQILRWWQEENPCASLIAHHCEKGCAELRWNSHVD